MRADKEWLIPQKENLLVTFLKRRGNTTSYSAAREAQVLLRRKKQEHGESLGQKLHWGFCRKARQGRVNSSGVASLYNVSGLWSVGVVFSCLISGPG